MELQLELLPTHLLREFRTRIGAENIQGDFDRLEDNLRSTHTFNYYAAESAVFSSRIEGVEIGLDTYIQHKTRGLKATHDQLQRTDDLYDAYLLARDLKLDAPGIEKVQALLTRHILPPVQQGKLRTSNVYIVTTQGKINYGASAPRQVAAEMEKFYRDLQQLTTANLSMEEVFYFAALLQIIFLKLHPFSDANGRMARLLEKWFLAEKLGKKAWLIPSERSYFEFHLSYALNIQKPGLAYDSLDYSQLLPFLELLPKALKLA